MKHTRIVVLVVLGLAVVALAQSNITRILNLVVQNQMLVGTTTSTGNKVTKMLGTSSTIDFATATTTCTESSGITVTGAAAGDPCFVGTPTTGGSTNASYTCYVSATDTVKVRHCAAGTADDPASATFYVRVISSQ